MITKIFTKGLYAIALCSISLTSYTQDAAEEVPEDKPVKSTFSASVLIENPTVIGQFEGALELNIQHRFANMENGIKDIFGIYGAANTRMALNYGITDFVSVGFGTEMSKKLQDLNWKVALLKQTRSGSMPVSVSYYGNVALEATDKENFFPEVEYRFIHRISYLTQIIVARKFNDVLSLQVSPKCAYFNAVDTLHKNLNYGIAAGGRLKFWESKAIMFEYDQPLTADVDAQPSVALGLEVSTATHAFQIFMSNYRGILGQQNMAYSTNDPFSGDFAKNYNFGFNIVVKF